MCLDFLIYGLKFPELSLVTLLFYILFHFHLVRLLHTVLQLGVPVHNTTMLVTLHVVFQFFFSSVCFALRLYKIFFLGMEVLINDTF